MAEPKNHYIKYKRAELESYINNPESCVKKMNCVERLRFAPNIFGNFKDSILKILSRKIGKYDMKMQGVVLDFRNTKILNNHSDIRNDSAYSIINVESNFYIFSPRSEAVVDGIIKHINRQSMGTIISVVIYRVFNVKVTFKGCIQTNNLQHNQEIKIRIKQFHFDNEIPYIEGEMINVTKKKLFEDAVDSGISESSVSFDSNVNTNQENEVRIKQERNTSLEPLSSLERAKKRKAPSPGFSSITHQTKKIKQEPVSEDEHENFEQHVHIKTEKPDSPVKKRKSKKEITNTVDSSSIKKKSKKKKKKSIDDDFESSLQLILDSSKKVKKERN